jgi:GNAT superfamily N-acetyltransferase
MHPNPSTGTARWRRTEVSDLEDIQKIADAVHAELPEQPERFAEKLGLFPQGCFVLLNHETVVGYGFSHPWLLMRVPPLNQPLSGLPPSPDCLLIHDVAIVQHERGRGAAELLVGIIVELARERHIPNLALVSVYNTHPLWARVGFEVIDDPALTEGLKTYGGTARYMVRKLK